MKIPTKWMLSAAVMVALGSQLCVQSRAGLFKIDFGQLENEREIVDADGTPTGTFPPALTNWNVIPTWTFDNPNANVVDGSASIKGTANAAATEVTWKLTDFSKSGDDDVTMTIVDNKTLSESLNPDTPPYALGQTANNPTKEALAAVYDGVVVPAVVKDDYMYRNPDTAGTELLVRFANLNPGIYNVTLFEGRTTDASRYGKVWVDDINGKNEPAEQNTGNYAGMNSAGVAVPLGQPRTVTVTVKAGDYLWFAEMEDNSGGISGMIVRSVDSAPPPVDISTSKGLFKIDFGQFENERVPTDADGNPTGSAPDPLKDWNVIPTWTFADPNGNVVEGSASIKGTANAEGTEVTWHLSDFSKDANTNVTMTIMDNKTLSESINPDTPPYALGQTANNPTKEAYEAVYDGVVVPPVVKDDYIYRNPDTAGTELLMRFAGLNPGTYNVTVFEGRTTDTDGRYGKVWADDINGKNEPATQNTGNYSGVNLDVGGVATPTGNPRTVQVTVKPGDYLWFAEMEDNSGGISGMIIRGLATSAGGSSGQPTELGQTVHGFQDDFNGATRNPAWVPLGPGGDIYRQSDGVLHVNVHSGDPNHLLYMGPGASNGVQEVLARVRVTSFGTGDPSRGGIGVGVQTNSGNVSRGINLHFRDFLQDNVPGRQFKLLDDARAWGPAGLRTNIPGQTTPGWTNNTWYWMRLRLDPKMDGTNTVFGKAWVADGTTEEPKDWQLRWADSTIPKPLRTGFAGITGASIDGIGNFEVDYILIKADSLPETKVDFAPTGPAVTPPAITDMYLLGNKIYQIVWYGNGALEQSTNVAGPFKATTGIPATGQITASGAGTFYKLRILQP